jgi:OPA family sugar phosphate sensor protein UhpC-like MFS transporter
MLSASGSVFWFEAGGIFGSLVAGWASDKVFQGRRGPINVLFSLAVVLAIVGLYWVPHGMLFLDYWLMFTIGFLIFGPQMLIGMSAAELSHKKAAGTATGFAGWWAYLGAAAAGYPITKVVEIWGWQGFFVVLGSCGVIAAILLAPLWGMKSTPHPAVQATEK